MRQADPRDGYLMTTIDWKALKPHIPLPPGASEYVRWSGSAGEEIARWILAGRSPLLVGGPAGVGKSTELARAADLLQPHRFACLVQLDRFENMRRLTPGPMLLRIYQQLEEQAGRMQIPLSGARHSDSPRDLLNSTLSELRRASRQGKVTLLIDGLEKIPQGSAGLDLFEALGLIDEESELVAVIPWHAAFGPQAETVIRPGERLVTVRAIEVEGDEGEIGRGLLRRLHLERLGWGLDLLDPAHEGAGAKNRPIDQAIRWSGGVPRIFLQLLADAGAYATLRRPEPWPSEEDLNDACADQVDSFRRLFLPGDVDAIRAVVGTSGSELELDRKIRLMAHGILLERLRQGARVLEVHPLARAAFDTGNLNPERYPVPVLKRLGSGGRLETGPRPSPG